MSANTLPSLQTDSAPPTSRPRDSLPGFFQCDTDTTSRSHIYLSGIQGWYRIDITDLSYCGKTAWKYLYLQVLYNMYNKCNRCLTSKHHIDKSDIWRQSHETRKGSHKLCFNCCSNLSKSLMLARLAVMPGRGFPGGLLPHAEWCSIIALCPPPAAAAAAQRRMGAVYTKTVALQSALPRSTLIVLLQCISQHEDCTQNQYSGLWWEYLQSIGTYSNVCRLVPNSRRQPQILILTPCIGALSECWTYSPSWSMAWARVTRLL